MNKKIMLTTLFFVSAILQVQSLFAEDINKIFNTSKDYFLRKAHSDFSRIPSPITLGRHVISLSSSINKSKGATGGWLSFKSSNPKVLEAHYTVNNAQPSKEKQIVLIAKQPGDVTLTGVFQSYHGGISAKRHIKNHNHTMNKVIKVISGHQESAENQSNE